MNQPAPKRRFRAIRGGFRERSVVWSPLDCGSTNRLWKGRGKVCDWLLKWYRYPEAGIHPEAEIARFLGAFDHVGVAGFGGILEESLGDGGWMTVALIQEWVEGSTAWEKVIRELRDGVVDVVAARRWGRTVGGVHAALSSGGKKSEFGAEPWTESDSRELAKRVEALGVKLLSALSEGQPSQVCPLVWTELRARWSTSEGEREWRQKARALAEVQVGGARSRIHGDLHLGQILEAENGATILVDFEGEPLRSIKERRAMDAPLRDVAGMWRSFSYAGAVSGVGMERVEGLQQSFLGGWSECMPFPEGNWRLLLNGLIWEKAIYETLYELRHRPDWMWVPAQAI